VRRDGAWTYVFGHLDAATGADALIEGARLFAHSSDGLIPWRGRPAALKRGLVARTPPFDFAGDAG
jgi:predicted metal-binding protein